MSEQWKAARAREVRPSRIIAILAAGVLAVGCAPGERGTDPPARGAEPTAAAALNRLALLEGVEVFDLTWPLSPDSIYWPTGSPFEHERLAWGTTEAGYFYAAARFASPEHLGTHMDAPIHFAEEGWTSAEIPVERLVGAGAVIDISGRAAADPDALLRPADVEAWEAEHGRLGADHLVIVRTGWAERWPDWNAYYGTETPTDVSTLHFPGVSVEAATLLAGRGVAAVGIDTASIDPGVSQVFEAHRVLAAAGVFNLENLTAVERLPASGFVVVALPMKIADGTGGPTRVVALVAQ